MIVKSIVAQRFMSYGTPAVGLDLPDTGIVLVTGPNGAGKSSLVEAVSTALWGRTLRGTTPWHDGADCEVALATDALSVLRSRSSKGKNDLRWSKLGEPLKKYDTATKAQDELDRVVGPYDVWRRTCVFSSQDASHFTLATDAERKRLLETLLGLERFDAALKMCRADLKVAAGVSASARHARDVHAERLRAEVDRRERAQKALADLEPCKWSVDKTDAEIEALDAIASKAGQDTREAQDKIAAYQRKIDQAREQVKQAERVVARVERGECPTCARPWDVNHLQQAKDDLELAENLAADADRVNTPKISELRADLEEFEEDRVRASKLRSEWMGRRAFEVTRSNTEQQLRRVLGEAVTSQQEAEETHRGLEGNVEIAEVMEQELLAVERVLSLTGVRSKLLADALDGIEQVSNAWLGRIAGWGMRLELRSYEEKATGGVKDAISLLVHGAGGGHGYHGASAGERRRIDVALLLALADVANGALGVARSTLFFDECFDALDVDGVAAVCAVLDELALDRPVVLVTHNPLVFDQLQTVRKRVRVEAGALKVEP